MNYSTHNQQMRKMHSTHRKPNYALRKLSVGVASVLLSTTIFGLGTMAHADTVTTSNDNNNTDQFSDDTNQQSQSVHHDQTVALQASAKQQQQTSTTEQQPSNTANSHQQVTTDTTPTKQATSSTTSQQVASQEQPNKQATTNTSTATEQPAKKETTSTFTANKSASVQNDRALTESKVSNNGVYTVNMTVSKDELESHFTWTVDNDGNVEVTGLKDASYMRDGSILVLPNAQDFIDAGIITAGHTAKITDTTLWHVIWDNHSQDLKELDVSNNGNQKLSLLCSGKIISPFANNIEVPDGYDPAYSTAGRYFAIQRMNLNQLDMSYFDNLNALFEYAKSLVDLAISDWNVSNSTDFSYLFDGCSNLQQLDVTNWDVSNGTDFSCMFNDCSNLQQLDVTNWDVSNGTDFSYMFADCSKLPQLDVANWDVSQGVNFKYMFYDCMKLPQLDVANWDVSNGTNFGHMFQDCRNLTQLDVAKWNVSQGTNFKYMFADCYNLESLAVANWDVANGTNFSSMFAMYDDDSKLATLDVTNWNVANGTNFNCMFYKDIALKALDVSKWNVANGTDFSFMFNFDTQLAALDVSKWNVTNGANFSTMFAQDTNLRTLDVANWNVAKGMNFYSMFYKTNGITYLDLQNWEVNPKANTDYMFGETALVVETKEQDPSLNNDQAETQSAAITPQPVTLKHDHITVKVNPSTQQFYYLPSATLNDDLAKIQSKIDANNPFFMQYASLLAKVKTPAQSDPDRGLELKAIILLAQLADADTSAQVDAGYQYTGLSSSSTSSAPNDILTATYTMTATPQPTEETWTKTDEQKTFNYEYRTWYQYQNSSYFYTKAFPDGDRRPWLNGSQLANRKNISVVVTKWTSNLGNTQWRIDRDASQGLADLNNGYLINPQTGYTIHYAKSNVTDDQLLSAMAGKRSSDLSDLLGQKYDRTPEKDASNKAVSVPSPLTLDSDVVDPASLNNQIIDVIYSANEENVTVDFIDQDTDKLVDSVDFGTVTYGWSWYAWAIPSWLPDGYHFSSKVGKPIPGYDMQKSLQDSSYGVNVVPTTDNHFSYYVQKDQNTTSLNPFDKTTVKDPDHLTDDEKGQVVTNIKKNNEDKHISTIEVGDDGNTTLTFEDGTKSELAPDQTIIAYKSDDPLINTGDADADLNPFDKTPVKNPSHLTDDEKDQVQTNIKKTNSDKHISTIDVKDNGRTIITFEDGTQKELTPDQTIIAYKSGDPLINTGDADADLNPVGKTSVKDPSHLTDDEKRQISDNIKKTNGDKHISTIDVKDNGRTIITFEDGTQKELTPDETITQLPAEKPEAPKVTPEEQSTTPGKTAPTGETAQVISTSTTKPVANQSSAQQQKQQRLPQTGDNHEVAVAGLGLAVAMMSMFGLKKRKED